MTFEELYFSKSKYSQLIIDLAIKKKRETPYIERLSSRYRRMFLNKSQEDFNSMVDYRRYQLNCLQTGGVYLFKRLEEKHAQRFTEDEWYVINQERERRRELKKRIEMSKSEYEFLEVSEETKEYLQYIDVLIMKMIGYKVKAIGKEMNRSHVWVRKRYDEIPLLDDTFKTHIKRLSLIFSQISDTLAVKTDRYYFYEDMHVDLNRKKPSVVLTCKVGSCTRGCIRLMKDVYQKFDWDNQNIFLDRQREFCDVFRECLGTLKQREAKILDRYFGCSGERETYSSIAKSYNISASRISQIKIKAIKKMRHPSRYKRIIRSLWILSGNTESLS